MADTPIYFFHGLESGPHGTKYNRLSEAFEVTSPDFQDMDIWERLEKAERETEGMTDLVVVGSSFGGLLAALLYSRHPDRFRGYVLMAPALYRDAVKEKCAEHGVEVTEVDDDHRLHGSLERMVEAVRQVLERR